MRHLNKGFAEVHYDAISLFIFIKFVRNILDIFDKLGTQMSFCGIHVSLDEEDSICLGKP